MTPAFWPRLLVFGTLCAAAAWTGHEVVLSEGRVIEAVLPRPLTDELHADRQALGVGAGVDFGREAAARTAERIALDPPFPPAAQ